MSDKAVEEEKEPEKIYVLDPYHVRELAWKLKEIEEIEKRQEAARQAEMVGNSQTSSVDEEVDVGVVAARTNEEEAQKEEGGEGVDENK